MVAALAALALAAGCGKSSGQGTAGSKRLGIGEESNRIVGGVVRQSREPPAGDAVLVDAPRERIVADHGALDNDDEIAPVRCHRHRLEPPTVEHRRCSGEMRIVRRDQTVGQIDGCLEEAAFHRSAGSRVELVADPQVAAAIALRRFRVDVAARQPAFGRAFTDDREPDQPVGIGELDEVTDRTVPDPPGPS
jgi:hypothetical protein